ncbi:MAG: hypothetical protein OEY38_20630, partial [Gammaproteobacteria bacterium]|nr:hypothetical protein [Gammaproteobacteria bacterium]
GSGYIQYNGGDQVLMGGEQLSFPGFNLNTLASTTYHLRYNKVDGWQLLDVTDTSYNPDSLNENNPMFDSKQTNMLAAKVETDATNNPMVTPLVNRDRLAFSISSYYGCEALPEKALDNTTYTEVATIKTIAGSFDNHQRSLLYRLDNYFYSRDIVTLNWARRSDSSSYSANEGYFSNTTANRLHLQHITENNRYRVIGLAAWVLNNPAGCLDLGSVMSGRN